MKKKVRNENIVIETVTPPQATTTHAFSVPIKFLANQDIRPVVFLNCHSTHWNWLVCLFGVLFFFLFLEQKMYIVSIPETCVVMVFRHINTNKPNKGQKVFSNHYDSWKCMLTILIIQTLAYNPCLTCSRQGMQIQTNAKKGAA